MKRRALLAASLAALAGCGVSSQSQPSSTPTQTVTRTRTKSPTRTPTPEQSSEPPQRTPTPEASETPAATTELVAESEWTQFAGTPAHTSRFSGTAVPDGSTPYWTFFTQATPPVVSEGMMYTVENAREQQLVARKVATGRQQWTVSLDGAAASMPAILNDLLIVQRPSGPEAYRRTDGSRVWEASLSSFSALPPLINRERIVVTTESSGELAELRPDGTVVWQQSFDEGISAPPAWLNGVVVYASDAGVLRAVSQGESQWKVDIAANTRTGPVLVDGTAYLQDASGTIYAVNIETGDVEWHQSTNATPTSETTPAVSENALYLPTEDGIYCVDRANGQSIWKFELRGRGSATTPLIDSTAIYFGGTGHGLVYALDLDDGTEQWTYRTQVKYFTDVVYSGLYGPPTPVESGLIVSAADGLHALGPQ